MIKAVIFDFDGTLLDSYKPIANSWQYTLTTLVGRGVTEDEVRQTMGEMLIDSMRRLAPEVDAEYAVDFYRTYQRDIFLDQIKLFDGTEEVLRTIKEAGYKNALLTSRLKASTFRALEKFGITELFDIILTASDTKKFKPDPGPVFEILEKIGANPEEALLVGDTSHDIEAGTAAGVFTVLVDWSFALPAGEFREKAPAPEAVIKSLDEIPALLNKTNGTYLMSELKT
jgi:pyrophosphatase PpaX